MHISKRRPEIAAGGPFSRFRVSRARIAFDEGAKVLIDADVDTNEAPHLEVHDLLEIFNMDKVLSLIHI